MAAVSGWRNKVSVSVSVGVSVSVSVRVSVNVSVSVRVSVSWLAWRSIPTSYGLREP